MFQTIPREFHGNPADQSCLFGKKKLKVGKEAVV